MQLVVNKYPAQPLEVLKRLAAAAHDAGKRIFCDDHWQTGFFLEQAVQIVQQGPTARNGDALVGDVGTQFRRGLLEPGLDGRYDLVERIGKGFEDLVGRYREAARHAFRQVTALDFDFADFGTREGRADFFLDEFGRRFADQHAVVAADVVDDGFVEFIAAHPDRTLVHHATQGNNGHFGGATADINNHGAAGIGNGQSGADGCCHGFFDEINLAGACPQGRLAYCAALDLRRAARNANDDARAGREHAARMHHADKLLEHLFGNGEVGNDAVLHGTNGFDVARHPTQHLLGFPADGLDDLLAVGAAVVAYGHHRWLVKHNPFAADIDQSIGGTEVDRHIAGEVTTKESEHGRSVISRLKENSSETCCLQAQSRGAEISLTNQTSNDNL